MFEIKKHYRGDLSYTIEKAANEELAQRFVAQYLNAHPEPCTCGSKFCSKLRIWNGFDNHWILAKNLQAV